MIANFIKKFTDLPVFENIDATPNTKRLAWLFSLVAVSTVAGFIPPVIGNFYIPISCVCLLFVLLCGGIKMNWLYVVMYIAFGMSALFASAQLFNSNIRYLLFLVITLLCTPCISSSTSVAFRSLVYRNMLFLFAILTIGSFFGYFLGVNYMRTLSPEIIFDVTKAGRFGGLYGHSMLLGPFSVLVALVFMNAYMACHKKILIVLFFISASAVIMSASRGATLALAVAVTYLFFFMKDIGNSRRSLIGLLLITAMVAIPIADRYTAGLLEKQQGNIETGGTLSSRESKWNNRIQEFKDNPILGVGFCAVDIQNYEDYNDFGGVEPGSTHLSILSMTGIVGIIPYLLVLIVAYKSVNREDSVIAKLWLSLFVAMITHAMFEGYAMFAGGLMCFVYWLTIGCCVDYRTLKCRNK